MTSTQRDKAKDRPAPNFRTAYLEGVKRKVALDIWDTIQNEWYDGKFAEEIGKDIGFDKFAIYRFNEGSLDLSGLIHILVRSGRTWRDLPPLPSAEERIRAGRRRVGEKLGLKQDIFWCQLAMILNPRWDKFKSAWIYGDPTHRYEVLEERGLNRILSEVVADAVAGLGRPPNLGRGPISPNIVSPIPPLQVAQVDDLIILDDQYRGKVVEAIDWLDTLSWEGD